MGRARPFFVIVSVIGASACGLGVVGTNGGVTEENRPAPSGAEAGIDGGAFELPIEGDSGAPATDGGTEGGTATCGAVSASCAKQSDCCAKEFCGHPLSGGAYSCYACFASGTFCFGDAMCCSGHCRTHYSSYSSNGGGSNGGSSGGSGGGGFSTCD